MSSNREQIPLYAADGTSLGFRPIDAAMRLIAGGYVKPAYGRKGHLKAIWLLREDGGNPVETHARTGTRYSFLPKAVEDWLHTTFDSWWTMHGVRAIMSRVFYNAGLRQRPGRGRLSVEPMPRVCLWTDRHSDVSDCQLGSRERTLSQLEAGRRRTA